MATIIREGKEIKLTDEEIRSIVHDEHIADIRYEVESALAIEEEEGTISFDSFASCPFGEYASASDARSDLITKCIEDILELEEIYDRPAPSADKTSCYIDAVFDNAEYMGFMVKEEE